MSIELLKRAKEKGVFISLLDGKLTVKAQPGALTDELRQDIKANKPQLIDILSKLEQTGISKNSDRIPKLARQGQEFPLSFCQQRLWFIDQLNGGSAEYNMPGAFEVSGDFDLGVAEQALSRIIERHEVLRTLYIHDKDRVQQKICPEFTFTLQVQDLTSLASAEKELKLNQLMREDAGRVFDLARDLMIRASFIRLENGLSDSGQAAKGVLFFNLHHIATDGWSMDVLVREFIAQYKAILGGEADPLAPLAIQYADYAHWQQQWLSGKVLDRQLDYWLKQLAEVPPVHNLLLDNPRPEVKQYVGRKVQGQLPAEIAGRLQSLAKQHQMTPFMLLHAALALVLSRHSNSQDIVLGTPVANRVRAELEPLIGFFVNTLVLRVDTSDRALETYLAHVRQVHLDAQSHQDVPFEQLVEQLNLPRSTAHAPLFQIMLTTMTEYSGNQEQHLDAYGVKFSPLENEDIAAKFDLNVAVNLDDNGVYLEWTYDVALFEHEHIVQFNEHLIQVLSGLASLGPKQPIDLSALPVLTAPEQEHLLDTLNRVEISDHKQAFIDSLFGEADNPNRATCLYQLLQKQTLRTPEAIALVDNSGEVSYRELLGRVNGIAWALHRLDISPGQRVAIVTDRSMAALTGLLGILAAGAAYVPLDPEHPNERLSFVLNDAEVKALITPQALFDGAQAIADGRPVLISEQVAPTADAPEFCADENHEAYVIYTSGSTGMPKGVMVSHKNAMTLVKGFIIGHEFVDQRLLMIPPLVFDASVGDIFPALAVGAALVLHPDPAELNASALEEYCRRHAITAIDAPAALWRRWTEDLLHSKGAGPVLPSLKLMMFGGESVPLTQVDNFARLTGQKVALCNHYGPTEASVCAAMLSTVDGKDYLESELPIGKPLAGVRLYVLDQARQLLPQGVTGELYIGGDGVTLGYLGAPELTAKTFIADPFVADEQARMYRTGDLVRWNRDGTLQFIGRIDHQVKIRGFRIDLGEIEQQLARCPGVASHLVMARADGEAEKRLVAYIVLTPDALENGRTAADKLAEIKARLQEILPDYMVPSAILILDEWPLTANGKIDKKALAAPNAQDLQGKYVAPETETEHTLTQIWGDLLKLEADSISTEANFFQLGGHSLLAIRLIAEIRARMSIELPVKTVFDRPTIAALALATANPASLRPEVKAITREQEIMPLSFAQQRLWFIDQLNQGSPEYNMPLAFEICGDFDSAAAEQALAQIIARHEILRTSYAENGQESQQIIHPQADFALAIEDLSALDEGEQQARLKQLLSQDMRKPFDLRRGPMVRASLIKLVLKDAARQQEAKAALVFNMHHIASDGWSMQVLIREFVSLYQAYVSKESVQLAPLAIQYADYAHWQRQWLQGEVLEEQLAYWQKQLAQVPPVHALPLDKPRPQVKLHQGERVKGALAADVADRLQELARAHQITPFMLVHSALALVLSRHSHSDDIVIGTPVANRMQAELEPLIGFFVNTLVLRLNTGETELGRYFEQVRQVHLQAQQYQDVPFELLVERLKVPRTTAHTPLFQILLTMNTDYGLHDSGGLSNIDIPGLTLNPISADQVMAKFDLNLGLSFNERGLSLDWVYDSSLFTSSHIEQLNRHLLQLLNAMAEADSRGISHTYELAMLSSDEQAYLLDEINQTGSEYARHCLMHELFEAQVQATPDHPALVCGKQVLTYAQLNSRANRLACYLRDQGVGHESLVGICLTRSQQVVISMLAVLKAGGAYVPLDPAYPSARLAYMLEDTALKHLLSEQAVFGALPETSAVNVIVLDDADTSAAIAACGENNLARLPQSSAADLAYVIYTSGSTGQPKGVMTEHRNVLAFHQAFKQQLVMLNKEEPVRWLSGASFSFDASVKNLLVLFTGGQIALLTDGQLKDPFAVADAIRSYEINIYNATPAMLDTLLDIELAVTPALISSGEYLSPATQAKINQYTAKHSQVAINAYGPTETTINSSFTLIDDKASIGAALANSRFYLLDRHRQPVPFGCIGELYIAGDGLARGYLNRPELTGQYFIENGLGDERKERLYKTGDLVRYLPDGRLAFVGRADEQVKIRGYRIEPGEIEQQLALCNGVGSQLVMPRTDGGSDPRLVAYIILTPTEPEEVEHKLANIKAQLQQVLPEYMLPSALVPVQEWPLTPNGKIDKQALPAPNGSELSGTYVAPVGETEVALTRIWAQLLNLDESSISTNANFFDLGGHSLLVAKLVTACNQIAEYPLAMQDIFRNQTIAELACVLVAEHSEIQGQYPHLVPFQVKAGSKNNLFLIHPVGGGVFCYRSLARHLDFDGNIYGIQASGQTSIEAMAACYLEEITRAHPDGNYHLMGWSLGGVVAYEMARHLSGLKRLILVDAFCPGHIEVSGEGEAGELALLQVMAAELAVDYSAVLESGDALAGKTREELLEGLWQLAKAQERLPADYALAEFTAQFELMANNSRALKQYRAADYSGRLELIKAGQNPGGEGALGWESVVENIRVQEVHGDHFSIMQMPYVAELAGKINRI